MTLYKLISGQAAAISEFLACGACLTRFRFPLTPQRRNELDSVGSRSITTQPIKGNKLSEDKLKAIRDGPDLG